MKINKKRIMKKFIKFDFSTILFFAISLITATFAWYAVRLITTAEGIEAAVSTWNIVVTDNGSVTNEVSVVYDDLYPGCDIKNKTLIITNQGSVNAIGSYKLTYLRILDEEIDVSNNQEILNSLAQNYPFAINFVLQDQYIDAGDSTSFIYSISWPLESGDDLLDGQWGNDVYEFVESEQELHNQNHSYEPRHPIEIRVVLDIVANDDGLYEHYEVGDTKLINTNDLGECSIESDTCVEHVLLDINEYDLYYIPVPSSISTKIKANQISSQSNETISLNNVFDLIKEDILDTNIVIDGLSNRIFGNSSVETYDDLKTLLIENNGVVEFKSSMYNYLSSNECYWINESYDSTHTFAIKNVSSGTIMLYPELNTTNCKYIGKVDYNIDPSIITFYANGGVISAGSAWNGSGLYATKNALYNTLYGDFPIVNYQGHEFNGWYSIDNIQFFETDAYNYNSPNKLYARWEELIVTFNPNGGIVSPTSKQVVFGSPYGILPTPVKTGYTFDGWYTAASGGTQVTSSTSVSDKNNHSLYAHWTPQTYTVTYNANGGNVSPASIEVEYDSIPDTFAIPTKTGYEFAGWYTAASGGTQITNSSGIFLENVSEYSDIDKKWKKADSSTFYAHWLLNSYTVLYNANGGSVSPASVEVEYDSVPDTFAIPTKTGSEFAGWYTDAINGTQITDSNGVILSNVSGYTDANRKWKMANFSTFYAHWNAIAYTVTFNPNGGSVSPTSIDVEYGSVPDSFVIPTKEGYGFTGWYTSTSTYSTRITDSSGNLIASVSGYSDSDGKWIKTSNTTLYAHWSANTYTITYNANGGNVSSSSKNVTYDSVPTTFAKPTRTGYSFAGWYTGQNDGLQVTNSSGAILASVSGYTDANKKWKKAENITLYAQWTANTYKVTYNANNGSVSPASVYVTYGSVPNTFAIPTREGHSFVGWYTAVSGGTKLTGSDGNILASKSGYTDSNRNWIKSSASAFYAQWTANSYTVTLNNQSGTPSSSSVTGTYGSAMPNVTIPSRSGFSFLGYYSQINGAGTQYYDGAGHSVRSWNIANNTTTLYAYWQVNSVTVTYNPNGGTVSPSSGTHTFGSTYGTLPTPEKTGYNFDGWYTASFGGTQVTSSTNVTNQNNHSIYAHWTAKTYTVTYNANGGSVNPSSTSVTYDSVPSTFAIPTKTGYTFDGWYIESIDATIKITGSDGVILASKTGYTDSNKKWIKDGNATFYAHWTGNTYTITFNNLGYVGNYTMNATCGSIVPSISIPSVIENFYIVGYFTGQNGTGTKYYDPYGNGLVTMGADNVTLYIYISPGFFDYTGDVQTFTAPVTGTYKLEVWGAQGGDFESSWKGGHGGYSVGNVQLNEEDNLYIYVGGAGTSTSTSTHGVGGYNGGGDGGDGIGWSGGGGGGGATHIAKRSGLLSTLSSYQNDILIVAGGGGGAGAHSTNYTSGGGYIGNSATSYNGTIINAGTQTTGYAFGQGQVGGTKSTANDFGCEGNGGGGGGLWGGYAYTSSGTNSDSSGAGGSGYIGNSALLNKHMFCYNCATSTAENTKTFSNGTSSCHSSTATADCAKEGNGYAKITLYASFTVTFDKQGGTGGTNSVTTYLGDVLPNISVPTKDSATFDGYYTGPNGTGTKCYDRNGIGLIPLMSSDFTLYANWVTTTITFSYEGTFALDENLTNPQTNATVSLEGNDWEIYFLTDGTLTISSISVNTDIFMVGGGGGGTGKPGYSRTGSCDVYQGSTAGGGGGYYQILLNQASSTGSVYIDIGAGGAGGDCSRYEGSPTSGANGKPTTISIGDQVVVTANGGHGGTTNGYDFDIYNRLAGGGTGGAGGDSSGIGKGGDGKFGGAGSTGGNKNGNGIHAFYGSSGKIYSAGGTGGGGANGAANTGKGGGGNGGTGGSGIVIIRPTGKTPTVFSYTGSEQTFTAPVAGTYKLEVWGAQGGNATSTYHGGYGGYSVGYVNLSASQNLSVYVGGSGKCTSSSSVSGGYNGGGSVPKSESDHTSCSGGGATHIAKRTGLLKDLSSYQNDILIVAGGGGGGYKHNEGAEYCGVGGAGGGFTGVNGKGKGRYGIGGTQEAAGCSSSNTNCGSFGLGGSVTTSNHWGSSGGGGFYGGGASSGTSGTSNSSGGGGSGYIGNSLLSNKYMFCYNCTTSDATDTRTLSNGTSTCSSVNATADCTKTGNGHAKITLISSY